eukprot:TRINITY_DN35168_c0_g1_i1.p1 TRINITY_DN35168_c0_g1~~TRINITY_DN35168_c0_g1_i1.p1  ORF type:complete len:710 (+),score=149.56 TRINITY_DN35168_c0_g1_i1:38-2167(+)
MFRLVKQLQRTPFSIGTVRRALGGSSSHSHLQRWVHEDSLKNAEDFWAHAADDIVWSKKWDQVLSAKSLDSHDHLSWYTWFAGGELNTCYNALDRHVLAGHGDRVALIYDSPVLSPNRHVPFVRKITYLELLNRVQAAAKVLQDLGVQKGDRVLLYMPMVPEAIVSMLAVARLGAVHSVVFGGFAAPELAKRIQDAKPKVIISASCGIEPKKLISYGPMLHKAVELSGHKPDACIVLDRDVTHLEGEIARADLRAVCDHVLDWHEVMREAFKTNPQVIPVNVKANDPLYILYTSGTTGKPKGIVRDNGGHAVALKWTMSSIYNAHPGDVYFAASDIGWVVGHSYIVYGPLLQGCTTILYEGKPVGTPDPSAFWRLISTYGVKTMFTAPTAIRAIKKEDPNASHMAKHDLSSLDCLFLAGERCDPDTIKWITEALSEKSPIKPPAVIDHWWQTETGWPITSHCVGITAQPRKTPTMNMDSSVKVKYGSAGLAVPGFDVRVVNPESGEDLEHSTIGEIAIKLPLPPGSLMTLWNDEPALAKSYLNRFPGFFTSGDAGYIDADGYVHVMSRVDDIINVAGHRLSTGAMEEILSRHPSVAECAVIAVLDSMKGELPVGFLVLKDTSKQDPDTVISEVKAMVRGDIGAVACFGEAHVVSKLPKTRSGKVLRAVLRKIANGQEYVTPPTIEDASALDEAHEILDPLVPKRSLPIS